MRSRSEHIVLGPRRRGRALLGHGAVWVGELCRRCSPFLYDLHALIRARSLRERLPHLGARYYDAQGHFTQPDPVAGGLGDPSSLTRYNYAGGDPINYSDATGLARDPLCGTKGSTGYYTPNCGGYITGGPGGPITQGVGEQLGCVGVGIANAGLFAYASIEFLGASLIGKGVGLLSAGLDAATVKYNPFGPTAKACGAVN